MQLAQGHRVVTALTRPHKASAASINIQARGPAKNTPKLDPEDRARSKGSAGTRRVTPTSRLSH